MKNSPETLRKRNRLKKMWKAKTPTDSFPHQIRRKCKDCGKVKMCNWNSTFTQTGKPEYKPRCKDCHNAYMRKRQKLDYVKIARNKRRKRDSLERKQKAIKLLGGKCKMCGYNKTVSALTFHHRNPDEKEFEVGIIVKDHNWEKVLGELKKCDLLCFNCHMEIHEENEKGCK